MPVLAQPGPVRSARRTAAPAACVQVANVLQEQGPALRLFEHQTTRTFQSQLLVAVARVQTLPRYSQTCLRVHDDVF